MVQKYKNKIKPTTPGKCWGEIPKMFLSSLSQWSRCKAWTNDADDGEDNDAEDGEDDGDDDKTLQLAPPSLGLLLLGQILSSPFKSFVLNLFF